MIKIIIHFLILTISLSGCYLNREANFKNVIFSEQTPSQDNNSLIEFPSFELTSDFPTDSLFVSFTNNNNFIYLYQKNRTINHLAFNTKNQLIEEKKAFDLTFINGQQYLIQHVYEPTEKQSYIAFITTNTSWISSMVKYAQDYKTATDSQFNLYSFPIANLKNFCMTSSVFKQGSRLISLAYLVEKAGLTHVPRLINTELSTSLLYGDASKKIYGNIQTAFTMFRHSSIDANYLHSIALTFNDHNKLTTMIIEKNGAVIPDRTGTQIFSRAKDNAIFTPPSGFKTSFSFSPANNTLSFVKVIINKHGQITEETTMTNNIEGTKGYLHHAENSTLVAAIVNGNTLNFIKTTDEFQTSTQIGSISIPSNISDIQIQTIQNLVHFSFVDKDTNKLKIFAFSY